MLNMKCQKTTNIPNLMGTNMYNSTGVVFMKSAGVWF